MDVGEPSSTSGRLGRLVVSGLLLALGTLLLVAGIDDFLVYLEGDIRDGVGVDLLTILVLSTLGWTLLLAGAQGVRTVGRPPAE